MHRISINKKTLEYSMIYTSKHAGILIKLIFYIQYHFRYIPEIWDICFLWIIGATIQLTFVGTIYQGLLNMGVLFCNSYYDRLGVPETNYFWSISDFWRIYVKRNIHTVTYHLFFSGIYTCYNVISR